MSDQTTVGQIEIEDVQDRVHPFDAWEFDNPGNDATPVLRLKNPWGLRKDYPSSSQTDSYTVLDGDGIEVILMTTGAADKTVTLPTVADNTNRPLTIIKADAGAGEVIVDGEGSETINGFLTLRLVVQYNMIRVMSTGTEWIKIDDGFIAPVAAEPSGGTIHFIVPSVVVNEDPDADDVTPNYNEVDLDSDGTGDVPDGATGVFVLVDVTGNPAGAHLELTNADGGPIYVEAHSLSASIEMDVLGWCPLDSSGSFWWTVTNANMTLVKITVTAYSI